MEEKWLGRLRGMQASFELFVPHLPFELFRRDAIRLPWRCFGCDVMCVGVQTGLTWSAIVTEALSALLPISEHRSLHRFYTSVKWIYFPVRLSRKFNCEYRPSPDFHKATKCFVKHSSECARRLSYRTNCGMFAEHSFGIGEISVSSSPENFCNSVLILCNLISLIQRFSQRSPIINANFNWNWCKQSDFSRN